jgi:hypothetical protein
MTNRASEILVMARERSDEAIQAKRLRPSSGSPRQGECEAFVRLPLAMTRLVELNPT